MPDFPTAVLLDANVYIAAIRTPRRPTDYLQLLIRLLKGEFRLVGNDLLATEYLRYAQVFPSALSVSLASAILDRMDVIAVEDRFVRTCSAYVRPPDLADIVHAATCLKTGAILVSNDKDFDPITRAKVIDRLTVTEAIRQWVGTAHR
ncbi:MAG: type II toxin-antitoxin system VapC family toxin [Thermoplasmata archaeon]